MFKTKEGGVIDEYDLTEAMVSDHDLFLNMKSGDIIDDKGVVEGNKDFVLVKKYPQKLLEEQIVEFIKGIFVFDEGERRFGDKLLKIFEAGGVEEFLKELKKDDPSFSGWLEWINTAVFDYAKDWLISLNIGIKEVLELDCSCPACHSFAKSFEGNDDVVVEWNFDNLGEGK